MPSQLGIYSLRYSLEDYTSVYKRLQLYRNTHSIYKSRCLDYYSYVVTWRVGWTLALAGPAEDFLSFATIRRT